MFFCPKCGSLMAPKDDKGKKYFLCSCGYNTKKTAPTTTVLKESVKSKRDDFTVMSEDNTTLPLTDEQCPQCKHPRAFWWTKQMRASDEPETKFLKCEKCKHTWRDRS